MRSLDNRHTGYITAPDGLREGMPEGQGIVRGRRRLERQGELLDEAIRQSKVQNFPQHGPPLLSSLLAGLRKCIGLRWPYRHPCGPLTRPDVTVQFDYPPTDTGNGIFFLGAVGALIYAVLSIVISLLKIGLLLTAAVISRLFVE